MGAETMDALRGASRRGGAPGSAGAPRLLVAAAGDEVPAAIIEGVVSTIRERWPGARVETLDRSEPWDRPDLEQREWIAHLESTAFDQAVIVGDGTHSPYALAYAFYLAGIPRRSGVSAEFGGKLLTHRLNPLGPGQYPAPHELVELDVGRSG
jgi:hypothetical protein